MDIKDLSRGEWYNTGINNGYYFKFNGWLDSKNMNNTDIITRGFYSKSAISNNSWWDGNCTLVTDLTEIQQFLPDNHPDKFTTQVQTKDDYKHLIKLLKQL
jgi:hypothetical protein